MTERIHAWASPQGTTAVTVVDASRMADYLVSQAAELPHLRGLVLLEHASCSPGATTMGVVARPDKGRPKVDVRARQLGRMSPHLRVTGFSADVETIPIGWLRADVILSVLETEAARRRINQAAWRLGVPWIDGGVNADGSVAWVASRVPGPNAPCWECTRVPANRATRDPTPAQPSHSAWTARRLSCGADAMAATWMTAECRRLLSADPLAPHAARRMEIDPARGTVQVTPLQANPQCPFDHATWQIEPLPRSPTRVTIAVAIRGASEAQGLCPGWTLRLEGLQFARRQYCEHCRTATREWLYVARRIPPAQRRCPICQRDMIVRSDDVLDELDLTRLTRLQRRRTLHSIGLRQGDVYSVCGPCGARHFEILGPNQAGRRGFQERTTASV